jgi:hypothetical protein
MPRKPAATSIPMTDLIAEAIAKADGGNLCIDSARYRRLALAALRPLEKPTEAMICAAMKLLVGRSVGGQQPPGLPESRQGNDHGCNQG